MTWHEILSWLLTAGSFIGMWIYRNRYKILEAASLVSLYVEKHNGTEENQTLEWLAMNLSKLFFPNVKQETVLPIIRVLCEKRKNMAVANGLYLAEQEAATLEDDNGKK